MHDTNLDKVLVLGAGKVGSTIAAMLAHHYRAQVTLADRVHGEPFGKFLPIQRIVLDAADAGALTAASRAHHVVINALPYTLAAHAALAAAEAGAHYFDLTEDVAATASIRKIAATANTVLMPQCGLAPGVIGMLGGELAGRFDELYDLRLRVGALARAATNALRYNFTWSIDGLINEYCNPCDAIAGGRRETTRPLEGYERFTLDGAEFEAFNTSGGLGTLCESLAGKVRNLDYKSIRYPGHRDAMSFLLNDMRLIETRGVLRDVLERAVPHTRDDLVIVFASACGMKDGRLVQETRSARIHGGLLHEAPRTAIELTTAAGVAGVYELLRRGSLPRAGFVSQEQVSLTEFLSTRVGHYYNGLQSR
ncbi:MAG: saccharopine dehydrogenase C-terminal domain-containing protein [Pseudomonadota bacterium]